MDKINKIIASLLAFFMVLSLGGVSLAQSGNDKIDWLLEQQFVVGNEDGDLNLEDSLTREEAATIIVKALGKEETAALYQSIESAFTDMNKDVWSNGMVNVAVEAKIVNGFPDKTFGPKKNITNQEIITMLVQVKGGLTDEDIKSAPWPTPYIVKAGALGILKDVDVKDLEANASRLEAFEMLYNTVAEGVSGDSYTALVTEIDRVHAIGKDEMGLIILDSFEDAKYEVSAYTRAKFKDIDDYQALLGKVIKVTLDDNNNIEGYTVDKSYDYLMGNVEFKSDSVVLNGHSYGGLRDVKFAYHNDKKISYNDLLKAQSDFARITVEKNNLVTIESFTFSKVEPIKAVDGDKLEFMDGRKFAVDNVILFANDTVKAIDIKDIKPMDIGHIYGDGNILISRQVALKGKLDNVIAGENKDVIVKIDDKDYKVSRKFNMFYSTDGKEFIYLDANKVYADVYAIRGQDIVYGLDLAGDIKYIVSSKVANEAFYIVDKTLSSDIKLFDINGKSVEYKVDLKSNIEDMNGKKISLKDLNSGDLVYITKGEDHIDKIDLAVKYSDIKAKSVKIGKDSKGQFEIDRKYKLSDNIVSLLFNEDGKTLKEVNSIDLDHILENSKEDSNLKAFMLSDYEFDKLKLSDKVITSGDKNSINLIIFSGFEQSVKDAKQEVIKLKYRFKNDYDDEIEGQYKKDFVKRKLAKDAKLENMEAGDFARFYLNEKNEIIEGELIFKDSDKFIEVVEVEATSEGLLEITVKENGKNKNYWASKDIIEIGSAVEGSMVKIHVNDKGEVDIILVK